MLHAKVSRATTPRRIIRIDTSAEALPGVRAVVTGAELEQRVGLYIVDKHILARVSCGTSARAVAACGERSNRPAGGRPRGQYEKRRSWIP